MPKIEGYVMLENVTVNTISLIQTYEVQSHDCVPYAPPPPT